MPRENNPTIMLKARKLLAKADQPVQFQLNTLPFPFLLAKPTVPVHSQPQFHLQTPQPKLLEQSVSKPAEWSAAEQARLLQLHNQLGNRWSLISRTFPGKSDNCIKNHFFSRLRMSLRHLNKQLPPGSAFKPVKMHVLYKIMATCQDRFNPDSEYKQSFIDFSYQLKNKILDFLTKDNLAPEQVQKLISDMQLFNRQYKMRGDILKIPKIAKIPKSKKIIGQQEGQAQDQLNYSSPQPLEISDFREVRSSNVPSWGNIQAILQDGLRLSQILQLKEERVQIRMVETSDYLFNDEDMYNMPQLGMQIPSEWCPFL